MKHTVTMNQKKETAGTVVYEATDADANPIAKSIYLAKTALAGKRPASITLTVEWKD